MGDEICLTESNLLKWVYFSVAGLSGKFCKDAGFRLQGCKVVATEFVLYGVNGCRFARSLQRVFAFFAFFVTPFVMVNLLVLDSQMVSPVLIFLFMEGMVAAVGSEAIGLVG